MVFCNRDTLFVDLIGDNVTILILIDGFLQYRYFNGKNTDKLVTILILIDGFLQYRYDMVNRYDMVVTILILIDGFLQ